MHTATAQENDALLLDINNSVTCLLPLSSRASHRGMTSVPGENRYFTSVASGQGMCKLDFIGQAGILGFLCHIAKWEEWPDVTDGLHAPAVFRRRSSHGQTLQLEQIHSFRSPSGTGLRRASFQREHFFATWRCSGTPCPLVMLQHITAFILASCSLHSPQACLENLSSLRSQPTAAVRGGGRKRNKSEAQNQRTFLSLHPHRAHFHS